MMSRRPKDEGEPSGGFAAPRGFSNNRLLAALTAKEQGLLLPHAEAVELTAGRVLVESGDDIVHTYFPTSSAMIALVLVLRDGSVAETATVGREGAVGGIISAGHKPAFARALVQLSGTCLRIETARIEEAKNQSAHLHDLFARYSDVLLAQVLQSVACNALHSMEQRCCRWLLMTRDRMASNELEITQEFIAQMLGTQRTTVTRTLGGLVDLGILQQSRGRITIRSVAKLEAAACECYRAVRLHDERVLPEVPNHHGP